MTAPVPSLDWQENKKDIRIIQKNFKSFYLLKYKYMLFHLELSIISICSFSMSFISSLVNSQKAMHVSTRY